MKPGQTPEVGRLIRLKCHDWSEYSIVGKFIKYSDKAPKRQRNQSRFCIPYHGDWIAAKDDWNNCEEWEYVTESDAKVAS